MGEESSAVAAGDRVAVASAFFRRAAVFRLEGAISVVPSLVTRLGDYRSFLELFCIYFAGNF